MKKYNVTVNGKTYEVVVEEVGGSVSAPTTPIAPVAAPAAAPQAPAAAPAAKADAPKGGTPINSPMPGNILKVNVEAGQKVTAGTVLCVLEAMKMENDIVAPSDGTVASVNTQKGASVNSGDLLFTIA